ncbi:hypothetical protein [Microlunatus endophyticus]
MAQATWPCGLGLFFGVALFFGLGLCFGLGLGEGGGVAVGNGLESFHPLTVGAGGLGSVSAWPRSARPLITSTPATMMTSANARMPTVRPVRLRRGRPEAYGPGPADGGAEFGLSVVSADHRVPSQ